MIVPIAVCAVVLIASFAVIFTAGLRILLRTDFFGSIDEQNLPWSERWGRRNARVYAHQHSPQFRKERKAIKYGSITSFSCFTLLFVVLALFGNPA
ncbi:hypothetical protein [Mesorhizobium sp. KR9-304]|uniref:hypothetical protein n=1 Tax=Mesorhizobium sp. KR9-304 TaxID=3156614 RepID=UPI0032B31D60